MTDWPDQWARSEIAARSEHRRVWEPATWARTVALEQWLRPGEACQEKVHRLAAPHGDSVARCPGRCMDGGRPS